MLNYLAIDAGGTSTRAALMTASGDCLGYGVAGGGNPTSRGFEAGQAALLKASLTALGGAPQPFQSVTVGMAGASLELPTHLYQEGFEQLGLRGEVMIESDLLAAFYSGTHQDNGYALIAGTGAVAARVTAGTLAAVADGTGWLLGDSGSGFWLGREVVRAVAAALDGRGDRTTLTAPVLAELGIPLDTELRRQGRIAAQQQLIAQIYALRPIEVSRFAPLVFAETDDAVSRLIVDRAAAALATTLAAAIDPATPGPVIFGGSVLTKGGTVSAAVMAHLPAKLSAALTPKSPTMVEDGMVGAAVMALKHGGEVVDGDVFARIKDSVNALRG